MKKTAIIICGPTASGKTTLALELAEMLRTEVVSADSRQCYRELNIGVARPSPEELARVYHHFIDSHSVHEEVNAAVFEQYALNALNTIFTKNDVAVVTGGTGLYINALCYGIDEIPPVPVNITTELELQYHENGISWLQQQLTEKDPIYVQDGEMQNPRRLLRALGVKLATGKSIREFQKNEPVQRPFNRVLVGIDMPRNLLYERINRRVDMMMEAGLLHEAEQLYPYRHLKALQTVGYAELFDYFGGVHSLAVAVELIKQNTRHYAKRQFTWFRKNNEINWFQNPSVQQLLHLLKM